MTTPTPLPEFRIIAAALRETTERLVGEVCEPKSTAPDWNPFEWIVARAAGAIHGISGLLAKRLRWRGPADWHEFLDDQHAHTLARAAHIDRLLSQLDALFRESGIASVALKGSALCALRVHAAGDRPQSDIDLLLDPADLREAGTRIAQLGYLPSYATRRHEVYALAGQVAVRDLGEHVDNPIKIELHTRIDEALPVETVDITATIAPAHASAGLNSYASRAALLRHVCLHAAGNMRSNAVRFIQIYDIAQLARRLSAADWHELAGEEERSGAWWLFAPLALSARYLPGSIPDELLARLHAVCPRRLRERYQRVTVYEVSCSNLQIAALPGREWSRSLGDTLRYAHSRIWPSRAHLDDVAATVATHPQLTNVRWYGASQAERMARWLFTRQPRVQTLSAVQAALHSAASP